MVRWLSQHTTPLFLPQKDIKMVGAYFTTHCSLVDYYADGFHEQITGKVQVALVWNSRGENSPSFEKLNALADVR